MAGRVPWPRRAQTLLSPPRRRRPPRNTPSLNAPRRALLRGGSRLASTWPEVRALSTREGKLQGGTGVQAPQCGCGRGPRARLWATGGQTHAWPSDPEDQRCPPAPDGTGPRPFTCSQVSRAGLRRGGRAPKRTGRRAGCVLRAVLCQDESPLFPAEPD